MAGNYDDDMLISRLLNMKNIKTPILRKRIHPPLLDWYDQRQRKLPWRNTKDPYAIWVSEVMLQQTQVKTVIPYYLKFMNKFPSVTNLAASHQQTVLKIWEGLGYYGRARNLHRAAKIIVHDHQGVLPKEWKQIRSLPGVGDYIAAAVLSIAYNLPYAVVDGNVKRVLARLLRVGTPVNQSSAKRIFKQHADALLYNADPGKYNQAIMELGALVCTPTSPYCGNCPIQSACRAYQSSTTAIYPRRIKAKPTPLYHIATGVVIKNDKVLITKRREEGLLGGLWEFPGGKLEVGESPAAACIRELQEETGLAVIIKDHLTSVRHAYTHFKIIMDVFLCHTDSSRVVLKGPIEYRWIALDEITDYPLPKANHKFLHHLREAMSKES